MKKMEYERPLIEVTELKANDIIRTSGISGTSVGSVDATEVATVQDGWLKLKD